MKKAEIRVGGTYAARVGGRHTTVRVDAIREIECWVGMASSGKRATQTRYDVTNLATGRKTTFRSAAKFHREAKDPVQEEREAKERLKAAGYGVGPIDYPADEDDERVEDRDPTPELEAPEAFAEGEQGSDPTTPTAGATAAVSHSNATASAESAARSATAPAKAAPAGRLAARIATARRDEPAAELTEEQRDIVATARRLQEALRSSGIHPELRMVDGQWVLVICAGAGTGKTFTLRQLEEALQGIGQYTAFNSSLVADSKPKFRRASCNTTHSLAHRAEGRRFAHRLGGARVRSWEVAGRLGISDLHLEVGDPYPEGSPEWREAAEARGYTEDDPPPSGFAPRATRRLKADFLAGQVIVAVRRFCQSADRQIEGKHFKWVDGVDRPGERANNERVRQYLLPRALAAWADLSDPQGDLPYSHDYYVKTWQLGEGANRPVIAADYILLDEYQDTAAVMIDVLRQQKHALLVLVGDDNQRIYEWRGAENAAEHFRGAERRLLSRSFRFGQAVADVANSVLAGLEEPTDLVLLGSPGIPSRVCEVVQPRCWLYRTNAGAVGQLMAERATGRRCHLVFGSDNAKRELVALFRAVLDLQAGRGTGHGDLGCFSTWDEVVEYSKTDEGGDLRLTVKLIEAFGAAAILQAFEDMPKESEADSVVCTTHRSKGREWPTVKLGGDFRTANKLDDAERRLTYVATTRAQEELDLTACPTFCGGWDGPKGSGPDAAEQQWVPGIEVAYTAPMPGEADLAAYRAARAARPVAAPPCPEPAAAAVGPANGSLPKGPPAPPSHPPGAYRWVSRGGRWCVQGPPLPAFERGVRVRVPSRQGEKEIILYDVLEGGTGSWLYGVDP